VSKIEIIGGLQLALQIRIRHVRRAN